MRTDAFFRGTHDEERLKPFADWNVRRFEDASHAHRELRPARATLEQSGAPGTLARAFLLEPVNRFLAMVLAMRTHRAVWPADGFQERTRLALVGILLRERNQVQFLRVQFAF